MSRDALIVGINTYQDPKLPNLNAPAEDGEAIASLLEQYGNFNITRLPEAINSDSRSPYVGKTTQVSLAQLQDALIKLFNPDGRYIPETALFYFSGHGIRTTTGVKEGFLATSNVNSQDRFYGLSLKWLRDLLHKSPIKNQIIFLDCCYSGELLNFLEADPKDGNNRCFITASRDFEVAQQDLTSDYSVLTKILLEGLDPTFCHKPIITNYSLVAFIDENLKNAIQRPLFTNSGEPITLTRSSTEKTTTDPVIIHNFCPYKGLEYFKVKDAAYFFGREKLTDELISKIKENDFLAIVGDSGSGKSSVLRAGLLYQLQLGHKLAGSKDWKVQVMRPNEDPLQSLALSFIDSNLSDIDKATQFNQVENLLKQESEGLRKLVQVSTAKRVLIVIDQFEEVFTLCLKKETRDQFFQCILEAIEKTNHKLCIIIAMRIDFLGKCYEYTYHDLGKKIQDNLIAVSPMETAELEDAILKPAKKVNLTVEPELVKQIVQDVENSPGMLPLVQYTLTELWNQKEDHSLTLYTYNYLGGIGGTLDKRATEIYNGLTFKKQLTAKHIFISLTQLGEGTEDTRRRVLLPQLITAKYNQSLVEEVIQLLAHEKLIVTSIQENSLLLSGVRKKQTFDHPPIIEVIHEALIRNWQLLKEWLNENRGLLLQQRKIETAAKEWREQGEKTDYLLQGKRLKEALQFEKIQGEQFPLSMEAVRFLKAGVKHQKKERIKILVFGAIIPLIISCLGYREWSVNTAWKVVQETQGNKYNILRHEALETLNFWRVSFENAPLNNANLENIDLSNANLSNAFLYHAYLHDANLSNANLSNAFLIKANLIKANLSNANLSDANLSDARLDKANLSDANLSDADLSNAHLYNANLRDADLSNAKLIDAKLIDAENLTNTQIKSACFWEKARFKGYFDYQKYEWIFDEKANQTFINQVKQDKKSDPKTPPYC